MTPEYATVFSFFCVAIAFGALWIFRGPREPRCPICHTNHKERHL